MPDATQKQVAFLVKLQEIEIEIRNIKKQLETVDQRIERFDKELLDFQQTIDEQNAVIDELNQKYRAYESDLQVNIDRIKKSEAKLSSVKTNKEYQSSLKEIDDLKASNSKLEDEMIEFLDRIEDSENVLKEKTTEFSELKARMKTEKEIVQREAEENRRRLETLDAEWKSVSAGIEAELLATYNRIKENQANKIGVVAVKDAVCRGCHMNIPPQMYNELQRGDSLKRCPICERIIYWEGPSRRSE